MQQNYVHCHSKWFAKTVEAVSERLETDIEIGLAADEAESRQAQFGPNALPQKKRESAFIKFLKHFHDILIYILFISAFITLVLGHYVDTIVILAVAVVNASIGFFQENKAEKALADIKNMLSSKALVVRDGERKDIDAVDLTLGDLVMLAPGDKVPADLRLIAAHNLKIEESALTGEAVPSDKQTKALGEDTLVGDRTNMAFSGTSVSAGTGQGLVVAIGYETEIGHISQLIDDIGITTTPLLKQTAAFGKIISAVILAIAALVYLFGHFFRDYAPGELLLSTIGLAIAAIPEGLPAILSIILAIGVRNMAKSNAIVRNLPSVETLGSVSVICSDKTGTLTRNEMTVQSLVVCDALFSVTGTGYAPKGEIQRDGQKAAVEELPVLVELLKCFRLCNDAALTKDEHGHWQIIGDPTEGALLTLYEKSGLSAELGNRLAAIPFDSEYKYMATLVDGFDNNLIMIKGAPDRLLEMAEYEKDCQNQTKPINREYWQSVISRLASQGQRIMGAAYEVADKNKTTLSHADVHEGIVFLGVAGIMDPPREEAIAAVKACQGAGIRVKMITGDHVETAKAIGYALNIGDGQFAITGRELEEMTPEQLEVAAAKYDVFARTSPEHKLKLVQALQARGYICAMTGDGVNDAPALRRADVGIAMGIKGTEVTKDSAEIVLADDNFSTIAAAVEEGRRVYDNLKKTILFILPTNGAESFLIIAAILLGIAIPLTALQILWVNMVTSVTVSLALAFEQSEPDTMLRPPRASNATLLGPYFIWRIFFVSVLIGGLTLLLNIVLEGKGLSADLTRTITIHTIVVCQGFHLFNSRSVRGSAFKMNVLSNKAVFVVCGLLVVLQLALTYLPFMNQVFHTIPLAPAYWLLPLLVGVVVFFLVEAEKAVMRRLDAIKNKNIAKGTAAAGLDNSKIESSGE